MRNKGFTLVELMVVVAIIIILAAILVPRYLDVTTQAKTSKCMANQRTLEGAASVYMADNNGTMPGTLGALAPGYVQVIPVCPDGGTAYTYDATTGAVTCGNLNHTRQY